MVDRFNAQPERTGAMTSFSSFEAFERNFDKVAALLPGFNALEFARRYGGDSQPPNVLNVALRIFNEEDDCSETVWSEKIIKLVNDRQGDLLAHGVRRLSIMICRKGQYP